MSRSCLAGCRIPLILSLAMLLPQAFAAAVEPAPTAAKGASMSYRQAREFLAKHTKLVELTDGGSARVLICPDYQGRVMTSTCSGEDGASLGWVNRAFITAGKPNPQFNNYGGEDRLWVSPEGGPFSLWFAPGAKQELANWFTPPALNDGDYRLAADSSATQVRMHRPMRFINTAKTHFQVDIERDIRLLGVDDFGKLFGAEAKSIVSGKKLSWVGFESDNTLTNRGPQMRKDTGLVSIWILGMMNSSPETVIIVPYRAGSESELGPIVKTDYFGTIPPERLKITPEAILFRGDSHYRSKIGTSQRRVKPVAGSIDFKAGVLTLVSFEMPAHPAEHLYMNNSWQIPQPHPYVGDVFNTYNDGPPGAGRPPLGAFYEIESLSPAAELATGQSLRHRHRTFHIHGDMASLARLAKITLGVDLEKVRHEMLK